MTGDALRKGDRVVDKDLRHGKIHDVSQARNAATVVWDSGAVQEAVAIQQLTLIWREGDEG